MHHRRLQSSEEHFAAFKRSTGVKVSVMDSIVDWHPTSQAPQSLGVCTFTSMPGSRPACPSTPAQDVSDLLNIWRPVWSEEPWRLLSPTPSGSSRPACAPPKRLPQDHTRVWSADWRRFSEPRVSRDFIEELSPRCLESVTERSSLWRMNSSSTGDRRPRRSGGRSSSLRRSVARPTSLLPTLLPLFSLPSRQV